MNSDGPEHWTGTTETYVIAEEFDFEGRGPPPDGRSAMAEKALDRMMADADALLRLQSASEGIADVTADDSDIQDIYAVRDAIGNVIEAMRDLEYRISPI